MFFGRVGRIGLALLLLAAGSAAAQETRGGIEGTIKDTTGACAGRVHGHGDALGLQA
jgi:hypothetical protein